MTITALPTPPLRSDGAAAFADRADTFLGALPLFVTEANALQSNVNAKELSASASASTATAQALAAQASATQALSNINFKGEWSTLTGALSAPASVYHDGLFWILITSTGDVTTIVPGVSASWVEIKSRINYATDTADPQGDLQGEHDYYMPAGQDGDTYLLERLGLFAFHSAATDPADGETCITPVGGVGRWMLICPTWDFVYAYLEGVDLDVINTDIDTINADITTINADITTINTDITTINNRFISASAALDFPSVAATTGTQTLTITVTGAEVGDRVLLAPPSALPAGLIPIGFVSATNTVSVSVFNNTAGAIDPASMTWGVTVYKG